MKPNCKITVKWDRLNLSGQLLLSTGDRQSAVLITLVQFLTKCRIVQQFHTFADKSKLLQKSLVLSSTRLCTNLNFFKRAW